jgi:hypothetical protein
MRRHEIEAALSYVNNALHYFPDVSAPIGGTPRDQRTKNKIQRALQSARVELIVLKNAEGKQE